LLSQGCNIDQAISAARSADAPFRPWPFRRNPFLNETNIMAFAAALPALRMAVNTGCSLGAAGYETNLGPSMTIGTGFVGGSSLSDNLTPQHLIQYSRIAYNKDAGEVFGNFSGLDP
jgi:acyl-CoA reductase-like NAD-dependent aldehyde dehydrogenase